MDDDNGMDDNLVHENEEAGGNAVSDSADVVEAANDVMEDISDAPKKKRILKPVPKLDTRRLLGPRGLPCLKQEFDSAIFKGKGHEEEDLQTLMVHLEHWAHRLYPKMMFDDCLDKIEKLGHKKEVHTCMRKIRLGMPLLNSDGETTVVTEDGPAEIAENDHTDDV